MNAGNRKKLQQKLTSLGSNRELGSATVELALVMPVLLIVVTGIFSLGQLINHDLELTDAVAIGGELVAVERGNTLNPCADVFTAVTNAAPYLNPTQLTFTFTFNGTSYGPYTGGSANVSCSSTSTTTGAAGNLVQGKSAEVQVTYPCSLMVLTNANLLPGCSLPGQITEIVQ